MTSTPALDLDLTDLPWVVGPTEARPLARWLPDVTELMLAIFDPPAAERQRYEEYVTVMMTRIAQADPEEGGLPYRLIRWEQPTEPPVVARFGLSERPEDDELERYLDDSDLRLVEMPLRELVPSSGARVTRSVGYSAEESGGPVFIEVKYVVDLGSPDVVALIHAGFREPRDLPAVVSELDTVAAGMRLVDA